MTLARALFTVGGLTLVSRVAGFVRDVLTAALLGAGPVADAFFVALRLPNLFRRLFAEGAFAVAFVPMVSAELKAGGRPAAIAFAEDALAAMLAVVVPLTVLALAFMPALITVLAPGFAGADGGDTDRFALAVLFSRITFPYLMLMTVVALMGGLLNAVDRFAPFAAAPIVFNLTVIASLLALGGVLATPGHALSWGVAAAGATQLVLLALACRGAGLSLRLVWPRFGPQVRRLARLMAPGMVGAGAIQLNIFVGTLLASLLPAGAISYLYFADRLYQLPLGVIGIALGTALLPLLSRRIIAGETAAAAATQARAVEYGLVLALPATAGLIAIPAPILQVLFERGAWGPAETAATAAALAAYAVGIPGYILVKVLATPFFARSDTVTPVRYAIAGAFANIVFSVALMGPLCHVGLALATSLAAWLNVALLMRGQARRGYWAASPGFARRIAGMSAASGLMGLAVWWAEPALAGWFAGGLGSRAAALALLVGGGAALYAVAVVTFGGIARGDLARLVRRS